MSATTFKTGKISDKLAQLYQNHQISETIDPDQIQKALSKIKNSFFVGPHSDVPGWLKQHSGGTKRTDNCYLIGRYMGVSGIEFYKNSNDILPRIQLRRPYTSHYELRKAVWVYVPKFDNNQIILTPQVQFECKGWGFDSGGRPNDYDFLNLEEAITREMETAPSIVTLQCPKKVVSFTTMNDFGDIEEHSCLESEQMNFLKLIGLS